MEDVPTLPKINLQDIGKKRFHRPGTLTFRSGYPVRFIPTMKIGEDELMSEPVDLSKDLKVETYDPIISYGRAKECDVDPFIPQFVKLDKLVLCFHGYFKETVRESPDETYRVRYVKLNYYVENNTISINEKRINNSGIPQGTFLKRMKVPKNSIGDYYSWKDLNVDHNINIFGTVFHLYDCDIRTREWLESQGIEVNPPVVPPADPFIEKRKKKPEKPTEAEEILKKDDEKASKFLSMDRKVLRFACVMDDFDQYHKSIRNFVLKYYLADDTMDLKEVLGKNSGRMDSTFFLKRHKVPKNRYDISPDFSVATLELSDSEVKEYFKPEDLKIGKTILIYNKPFLLIDCDKFTKAYYWKTFGYTDFKPIDVSSKVFHIPKKEIPPWNMHGSLDDSMQNVKGTTKPPRKDYAKMVNLQGQQLRYLLELDNPHPIESGRRFVMTYYLADDTLSLYEIARPNTGFSSGKFLAKMRVRKPGCSEDEPAYYGPQDFEVGGVINLNMRKFKIVDVDSYVLEILEKMKSQIPEKVFDSVKNHIKSGKRRVCDFEKTSQKIKTKDNVDNSASTRLLRALGEKEYKKTDVCCPPIKRTNDSCKEECKI